MAVATYRRLHTRATAERKSLESGASSLPAMARCGDANCWGELRCCHPESVARHPPTDPKSEAREGAVAALVRAQPGRRNRPVWVDFRVSLMLASRRSLMPMPGAGRVRCTPDPRVSDVHRPRIGERPRAVRPAPGNRGWIGCMSARRRGYATGASRLADKGLSNTGMGRRQLIRRATPPFHHLQG
jgi:hypothetical protein